MTRNVERAVWYQMRRRCTDPNEQNFKHYGGRGITVCERWQDFNTFIADMGPRPIGPKNYWTLERLDNERGYEPSNCKWATRKEQIANKRSHGWNRLTREQARAIRADLRRPYRVIAADYGVTRHMVGMIVRGDVWVGA
jgi:hypothetical protein